MIRLAPVDQLQRAGRVARIYSLDEASLLELHAARHPGLWEAPEADVGVATNDSAEAEFKDDGSILVVRVKFDVAVECRRKGQSPDRLLGVQGVYELTYQKIAPPEAVVTLEDAQLFARINGIYNAWPFLRETVNSMFTRLGYLPYTLDSLVIAPAHEPEKKAKVARAAAPKKARADGV